MTEARLFSRAGYGNGEEKISSSASVDARQRVTHCARFLPWVRPRALPVCGPLHRLDAERRARRVGPASAWGVVATPCTSLCLAGILTSLPAPRSVSHQASATSGSAPAPRPSRDARAHGILLRLPRPQELPQCAVEFVETER